MRRSARRNLEASLTVFGRLAKSKISRGGQESEPTGACCRRTKFGFVEALFPDSDLAALETIGSARSLMRGVFLERCLSSLLARGGPSRGML